MRWWPLWSREPEVEPWPSVEDTETVDAVVNPTLFKPYRKEKPKMSLLRYDVTVTFTADPENLAETAAKIDELRKVGTLKIKTTNVRAPKSAEE